MNYLIDTDILIYSLNNNKNVNDNMKTKSSAPKSISVITYGELVYGAEKSTSIQKNLAKVHRVGELFPVINITPAIMDTFGAIKADLVKKGKIIDDMDLLIASTAITHNLTLVTNNEKHFNKVEGLKTENWT
ncbi:MAG: type II toxin-antitoxin system VapC family toxin [Spirochaetales bacterium]|nr:type II toxin-antitoxin system VapC family toxin [Spirochaetales bacterium]